MIGLTRQKTLEEIKRDCQRYMDDNLKEIVDNIRHSKVDEYGCKRSDRILNEITHIIKSRKPLEVYTDGENIVPPGVLERIVLSEPDYIEFRKIWERERMLSDEQYVFWKSRSIR